MSNTNPRTFDPTVVSEYEREFVTQEELDEIPDHVLVRIAIDIARTHSNVDGSKVVHIPAK